MKTLSLARSGIVAILTLLLLMIFSAAPGKAGTQSHKASWERTDYALNADILPATKGILNVTVQTVSPNYWRANVTSYSGQTESFSIQSQTLDRSRFIHQESSYWTTLAARTKSYPIVPIAVPGSISNRRMQYNDDREDQPVLETSPKKYGRTLAEMQKRE